MFLRASAVRLFDDDVGIRPLPGWISIFNVERLEDVVSIDRLFDRKDGGEFFDTDLDVG
jgi:hypothetical protein